MLNRLWNALWSPSKLAAATLLTLGGLVTLVLFGGFTVFLHHSNSLEFCVSCHEMDTPYNEYAQSAHAANRTGAHAVCADCHVPKALGPMLVRKVMATNHVIQMVLGKIDTPEKYEANRLAMAQKVWTYMEKHDSRECHNCHGYDNMIRESQNDKAQRRHKQAAISGEACVSCHKGLAHRLPDFDVAVGDARQHLAAEVTASVRTASSTEVVPAQSIDLYDNIEGTGVGTVLAGAPLAVMERRDGWIRVRIDGWRSADSAALILTSPDRPAYRVGLKKSGLHLAETLGSGSPSHDGWEQVQLYGWIENADLASSPEPVWRFAETVYELKCGQCHRAYPAETYTAEEWAGYMKDMKPYAKLDTEDHRLVQIFLQTFASAPVPKREALAEPQSPSPGTDG
ncbi:MAG: NapC/NirT family cytochrome c [Alphaproteobacteria bacterium]|nr:NapC/NirT family cytochrome c [Alphaproteobacteria bacterium]